MIAPRRILILGVALSDRPERAAFEAGADDLEAFAVLAHRE
jgi:hypothetical protein